MSDWVFWIGLIASVILATPAAFFIKRFPREVQLKALTKAFFLWFFATSPVFAAIIMSQAQAGSEAEQVKAGFLEGVSFTEAFVYTAAFVSPVLYMLFDFLHKLSGLKTIRELKQLLHNMRGMPWIILSSLILLGVTLLAYGNAKSNPDTFATTLVARALTDKGWMVYIVSLLIWYCVILWEQDPEFSFERQEKKKTSNFADEFAKRKAQEQ
jgi:hypothetical protein